MWIKRYFDETGEEGLINLLKDMYSNVCKIVDVYYREDKDCLDVVFLTEELHGDNKRLLYTKYVDIYDFNFNDDELASKDMRHTLRDYFGEEYFNAWLEERKKEF